MECPVRTPRKHLVAQAVAFSFAEGITDSFSHSSWHIFSALSASINPQHSHRYASGLSSWQDEKSAPIWTASLSSWFPNTCGLLKRASLEQKKSAGGESNAFFRLLHYGLLRSIARIDHISFARKNFHNINMKDSKSLVAGSFLWWEVLFLW